MPIEYVDLMVLNGRVDKFGKICLVLNGGQPILLGEGAFARVYLGSQSHSVEEGKAVALKFLMKNESPTAERNFRRRFLQEARRTHDCTRWNLSNYVVSFFGFGRIGAFTAADHSLLEEAFLMPPPSSAESALFTNVLLPELDTHFAQNATALSDIGVNLVDLTGEFYAMKLCLVSLEEVLLTDGQPLRFSSHAALERLGIRTSLADSIQRWQTDFGDSLTFRSDSNGFQDLVQLDEVWRKSLPSKSFRSLRSAVQFALALRCLGRVEGLHQVQLQGQAEAPRSEERGYAHRDIKPGNILLSLNNPAELLLGDLGWVATSAEIRTGNLTLGAAIEDGGALPRGSRGFQAPEQVQSSETVSFTVVPRDKRLMALTQDAPRDETEIAIYSHFSKPQPGDWLFVKRRFTSGASKTRITKVENDERGDSRCLIPTALVEPDGQLVEASSLVKGQFVKDVSLHSDIFSVGLLAYYIGSEGRDPEEFIATFLSANRREIMKGQLPDWVLESPFWFAAVLCQQDVVALRDDLIHCLTHPVRNRFSDPHTEGSSTNGASASSTTITAVDDARIAAVCGTRSRSKNLKKRFKEAVGIAPSESPISAEDLQRIKGYRRNLADNKSLREMLVGRVHPKHPISFAQLYLSLLCCLRNARESVVRRQSNIVSRNGDSAGVYHQQAADFAWQIGRYANTIGKCPSLDIDLAHWSTFADPLNLFIAARFSATRKEAGNASRSAADTTPKPQADSVRVVQATAAGKSAEDYR